MRTSLVQSSFNAIKVIKQRDGAQTMRQRTLWSRQTGGGHSSGTLSMDPDDADEKQVLALLASGFEVSLDKDGSLKDVRAVDQQAFATLLQRRPDAAALFAPREPNTGLRPLALPDRLSVGQEFARKDQSGSVGALSSRMRVTALTDEVALVDVQVEGDGVRGGGQQAIRRRDGMPIEMQFELVRDAKDGQPATTVRVGANNMAYPPYMELGADVTMYQLHRDGVREALANPPFSTPSDDAGMYRLLPEKEGELSSWMMSPAALDQIDENLMFAVIKDYNASRPLIAMGGKIPDASPNGPGGDPLRPLVLAELHKATLLDASGRELPDLATTPVHRKIMFVDEYRTREKDTDFPFRLPLSTRAAQLTDLETIRLDVGVEAYAWSGSEAVPSGAQPADHGRLRITWTGPARVTFEQDRPPSDVRQGQWTVAVPMDAKGQQIPSAILETSAFVEENDPLRPPSLPPLDWTHRRMPMRQEIATAQPIAVLHLRHYHWEQVPRQWNLPNAKHMLPLTEQP